MEAVQIGAWMPGDARSLMPGFALGWYGFTISDNRST
jgi:hypothetical protein